MQKYPDQEFWNLLKLNEGWDSLMIFQSDFGKELLERKYKEWNYKIKESKKFELTKKIGSDIIMEKKPKNLRQFLS